MKKSLKYRIFKRDQSELDLSQDHETYSKQQLEI